MLRFGKVKEMLYHIHFWKMWLGASWSEITLLASGVAEKQKNMVKNSIFITI